MALPASFLPALAAAIGLVYMGNQLLSLLGVFYKTLLRGGKNLKKYGEWAVVTGATDGIGKAMAIEFARKGLNVMLIGRSAEKLATCKAEIAEKFPNVQVRTDQIDFATFGRKDAARVEALLGQLEVGVLVNNVGISYDFPQWLHELTDDEISKLMNVNLESVVWMTRAVLPQMLARKKGAIVNMSSASARFASPLLAVYASTKNFLESWTKSLAFEYESKGISFQCQSPLWVATSIVFPNSKVAVEKRATIGVPTSATYARYAVARIGYDVIVSPYWVHELAMWFMDRVPESMLGKQVLKMHKAARFHKKNVARMEEKLNKQKSS